MYVGNAVGGDRPGFERIDRDLLLDGGAAAGIIGLVGAVRVLMIALQDAAGFGCGRSHGNAFMVCVIIYGGDVRIRGAPSAVKRVAHVLAVRVAMIVSVYPVRRDKVEWDTERIVPE
jgi:hypothetical protein